MPSPRPLARRAALALTAAALVTLGAACGESGTTVAKTGKPTATVSSSTASSTAGSSASSSSSSSASSPTLSVAAPSTVAAGAAVPLDVTLTGITIVAADGDSSGTTGHLHVFIDRDPLAAGTVIPKGDPSIVHSTQTHVEIPGLANGSHTFWVVVGDGNHTALATPAPVEVTVTVG